MRASDRPAQASLAPDSATTQTNPTAMNAIVSSLNLIACSSLRAAAPVGGGPALERENTNPGFQTPFRHMNVP
jgi:hypothetical protein